MTPGKTSNLAAYKADLGSLIRLQVANEFANDSCVESSIRVAFFRLRSNGEPVIAVKPPGLAIPRPVSEALIGFEPTS